MPGKKSRFRGVLRQIVDLKKNENFNEGPTYGKRKENKH